MTWCSSCQSSYDDGDGIDGACGVCSSCLVKEHEAAQSAEATGPCIGCGERNHVAHNVSICATCVDFTRERGGHMQTSDGRWLHGVSREGDSLTARKSQGKVFEAVMSASEKWDAAKAKRESGAGVDRGALNPYRIKDTSDGEAELSLTGFEASMLLCVLAVAKSGESHYDKEDAPLRRGALERAYEKVSAALGAPKPQRESE